MNFTRFFVSGSLIFCASLSPMQLTAAPFPPIMDLLEKPEPFVTVSPELFQQLGKSLALPDAGRTVKELADKGPGGAFDPRDLERIAPATLGYRAKWAVVRYPYYGLDWDITGLRLESLGPNAKALPWIVIINGGSANWYEFFVDPLNRPGLGQYLAQSANVLIVTIPGNFKYGGWTLPASQRAPQYLLDRDLSADEVKVRNAIYTNSLEIEGLRRLIVRETTGDILIIGHSTSGELGFLAMGEKQLATRLKGRFLGWGSGGPSNLRKEWEEQVGRRAENVKALAKYPPLWELRPRDAEEYVNSGYIGPLNPVAAPGMTESIVTVAEPSVSSCGTNAARPRSRPSVGWMGPEKMPVAGSSDGLAPTGTMAPPAPLKLFTSVPTTSCPEGARGVTVLVISGDSSEDGPDFTEFTSNAVTA